MTCCRGADSEMKLEALGCTILPGGCLFRDVKLGNEGVVELRMTSPGMFIGMHLGTPVRLIPPDYTGGTARFQLMRDNYWVDVASYKDLV